MVRIADGSVRIDVGLDTSKAEKDLDKLKQKIGKLESELSKDSATRDGLLSNLAEVNARLDDATERVRYLKEAINSATGDKKSLLKEELAEAIEEQRALNSEATKLNNQYDRLKGSIASNTQKLREMKGEAGNLTKSIEMARPADALAASFNNAKTRLISFVKAAVGIATVAALFKRLKDYTVSAVKAFAEGDAETKANMDSLRNSLAQLKASWGAAFAPIVNAVIPILQKLISWLTAAANAIAQFFAVLSGKTTYKKAIANTAGIEKGVSGVGDAAEDTEEALEEVNKQLLGFDELNILTDSSKDANKAKKGSGGSGGGGGGGAGNAVSVVEEDIAPWAQKLADHLKLIRDLALAVGAALLTWKVAKFIGELLGVKLTLKQILGFALAVGGSVLYLRGFIDAWNNGVDWDNLAEMVGGAAIAFLGLGLAIGFTNAAWLLLAAGIGMLVEGIKDWIEKGELSTETFWLLEAGIVAVGVALALLISPWALVVAAVAAAALAIYKHWDKIKEKWAELLDWIKQKWAGIKEWWNGIIGRAKEAGAAFIEKLMGGMESITSKMSEWWNTKVRPWFTAEKWMQLGQQAMESIRNGLSSISLPKFHFYWETTGYTASFFGKTFTVNIPFPHLDWYARGGIFDSASVIGVGENGKEAVVPLERNTEWINLVADGLIERLTRGSFADQLAQAFATTPMPAMASGAVVPPGATTSAFGSEWGNSLMEEIKSLRSEISALASQPVQVNSKVMIDKRQVGTAVTEFQRDTARAHGG